MIQSARTAFGAPPFTYPMELAITVKAPKAVTDKAQKTKRNGEKKGLTKLVPSRKRKEITEAPGPRDGTVSELPDIRI